jgi:hypothetical protein
MSYSDFKVGIWHPFGPHGLETVDQIIKRKRQEIEHNGWTFWSFQYRRPEVLDEWSSQFTVLGESYPIVFCSNSPSALDPAETGAPVGTTDCQSYRYARRTEWRPLPRGVRVPHPFRGRRRQASAFIVQRIAYPLEPCVLPALEWLSKGNWQTTRIPTRGEYLVRRGGSISMRSVRAILELREPYLATVSADAAPPGAPADGPRPAGSARG